MQKDLTAEELPRHTIHYSLQKKLRVTRERLLSWLGAERSLFIAMPNQFLNEDHKVYWSMEDKLEVQWWDP